MKKISLISLIIVLIDQLIKILISNTITYAESIKVIPNFFYLTNVHNEGAAWSMFSGKQFVLIIVAVLALVGIYLFLIKGKKLNKLETICYSLLIGGIIGNLIDRVIFNYVIDYLEFIFGNYHYPVFNFADMCIVISIFTLVIMSFKEDLCKKSK
ncbi:MAG: signal peptidase II [Bacilli bacterium]|nr:signal peptidase II [Bacilli bacterium]